MKLSMKKRAQSMHAGLQKFNYLEKKVVEESRFFGAARKTRTLTG